MNRKIASTLFATGMLALCLTACGSGDDEPKDAGGQAADAPAQVNGTSGKQGDFKPDKKAPDSAGDRKPNAPDKGIPNKPGGAAPVSR